MRLPYWLLRLLPMWDYICPKCKGKVKANSHKCAICGEKYPMPVRVPPLVLKDKKVLEEYVHKHIFPKVSPVHRAYLTQFFTELLNDGFESGDLSAWTGTGGTAPSIDGDPVHHGDYSIVVTADGYVYYDHANTNNAIYGRCYVYFTSLPTDEAYRIQFNAFKYSGYGFDYCFCGEVYRTASANQFRLYDGYTDTFDVCTTTPQTGQWYCIEVMADRNGTGEMWINGTSEATLSCANVAVDMWGVGSVQSHQGEVNVDCCVLADAPIGQEAAVIPKDFSDAVGASDAFAIPYKALKFADAVAVADVFAIVYKALEFSDSVTLADAFATLYKELGFADSVSLVDAFLVTFRFLAFADTVGLSDAFEKAIVGLLKEFSDAINVADAFAITQKMMEFSDSVTVSDAFVSLFKSLSFADSINVSAAFAIIFKSLKFSDAVTAADVFGKEILGEVTEKYFSDSISVADAFAIVFKMLPFTDSINVVDTFTTPYKEMGFADSITVADTFATLFKMLSFAENVSIADAFSIAFKALQFEDMITVNEVFQIPFKDLKFTDSISIVDAFHIIFRALQFTDAVTLADAFTIMAAMVEPFFISEEEIEQIQITQEKMKESIIEEEFEQIQIIEEVNE